MILSIILGISGLALGLSLMIWALKERTKRHNAEREVIDLLKKVGELELGIRHNVQAAKTARDNNLLMKKQLKELRTMLLQTRLRLVECKDPKVIKTWLDHELNIEEL